VLADTELDLETANARRTGQAQIDVILDALFGGDQAALDQLVLVQSAVCHSEPRGLGDVEVCPEGVEDGSTVEFFTTAACEGYPLHQRPFVTALDPSDDRLVAVVAVEPRGGDPVQYWPDGDYLVIVLPDAASTDAVGITIDAGMIVRTQTGCATVESLFALGGADATDLLAVAS